ncbi:MAG: VOC family protein [Acidobacteriota bacterium]|nr:VOC family protein [Acidobacteriota bacterium]
MVQTCPIIAFLPTLDADKARRFYAETLGLRLVAEDAFALVFDANGVMLRVVRVEQMTPAPYTVLGWQVTALREYVTDLAAKGVRFLHYPPMQQTPEGIWTSPGGAQVAWFQDPDGNTLSLTQLAG